MAISLTTTKCEAFIGRELNEREAQNFDLFREVAKGRLNNLLGRNVSEIDVSEIDAPEDLTLIRLLIARMIAVISDE